MFAARTRRLALATVAGAMMLSCATNPVTGRREFSLISESQEIEMGRQYSAEVVQSVGLVENQALQSYVKGLGTTLAATSERPSLPWEFHAVEDASVNAFALPGGFIFVTRGLLVHLTNEAELVSVLGHEIGHVTARHSVRQMSNQTLLQGLLIGGMIVSPTVAKFGDLASAGLGVLFLKFGRDDELQADELGFKYSLNNGYDVREMVHVFQMLDAQAELRGAGRLPEWQSTHPDPGNRIRAIQERLAGVQVDLSRNRVGEQEFLARIDGLVFGENPRLGFFENNVFMHPDLRFRIEFPDRWNKQNQPSAVVGISTAEDALVELRLARGTAMAAAQEFFSQQGIQSSALQRGTVNGLPSVSAEFQATVENGTLRGIGTFIEHGGNTYRILTYTPSDRFAGYASTFRQVHGSFAQLTDPRALNVQPMRVKVERVQRAMTLSQFNQQYPSAISLEELAVINGVAANENLAAGSMVKRVVR
jgi:predicted Zn-dependent protease